MAILNPEHLFDLAARLVAPTGGGAPRQVDLRRAVSTAYYGLFHAVATAAADRWAGAGPQQRKSKEYSLAYRHVDHSRLKRLCEAAAKGQLSGDFGIFARHSFGGELRRFALTVAELQERRHAADYDPFSNVRVSHARLAVTNAREAADRFWYQIAEDEKLTFLSLLMFRPR